MCTRNANSNEFHLQSFPYLRFYLTELSVSLFGTCTLPANTLSITQRSLVDIFFATLDLLQSKEANAKRA